MSRLTLLCLILVLLAFAGCQVEPNNTAPASSNSANVTDDGKIAITTTSEEARKEFLAARDLSEKLRLTDSIQHFDKAIALDPNFALAHLNRAKSILSNQILFQQPVRRKVGIRLCFWPPVPFS